MTSHRTLRQSFGCREGENTILPSVNTLFLSLEKLHDLNRARTKAGKALNRDL